MNYIASIKNVGNDFPIEETITKFSIHNRNALHIELGVLAVH